MVCCVRVGGEGPVSFVLDSSFFFLADGRVSFTSDGVAGFDWSGITIRTKVCGATLVALQIQDVYGVYAVMVDTVRFLSSSFLLLFSFSLLFQRPPQIIQVNPTPDNSITLPSIGCHSLKITKITEASNNDNGVSLFRSSDCSPLSLQPLTLFFQRSSH